MKKEEIISKVKKIISDCTDVEEGRIMPEALLENDLGIDRLELDFVQIIMDIEEEFGIKIPDEDAADKLISVGDVLNYTLAKVAAED